MTQQFSMFPQGSSAVRRAIGRLAPVSAAASFALMSASAHANFEGCLSRQAQFVPSSSILVPAQPVAGTTIYGGKLVADFNCQFTPPLSPGLDDFVLVGGATPFPIAGTPYLVKRGTSTPVITTTGSPACSFGPFNDTAVPGRMFFPAVASAGSGTTFCAIHAEMDVDITYSGTGTLVDIPQDPGILSEGPGWAGIDHVIDGEAQTALAGPIRVTVVTCSLATTNMTVRLDDVSTSDFSGRGSFVAPKPFRIALTGCENSTSNFAVNATWSYVPIEPGLPAIENTGSPTRATNVGIQMRDSNGNPIADGATTLVANVSSGVVSYPPLDYVAGYYATGPVTGGHVRGIANLVLSYQ